MVSPLAVVVFGFKLDSSRAGFRGAEQIHVCATSICSTRQWSRQLGPHALFWCSQSASTVHLKRRTIGCWSQGLLGHKEGRPLLYLFGLHIGERRAFEYYSNKIFQVYDIEANLRRVPFPFIILCDL